MSDTLDLLRTALAERYAIERVLGKGGMATVFLAEEHHPRRPVAIKVLDPDFADQLMRERFVREVDFVSKLIHPHIVPMFAAGEADGLLYYVMPYVEGESLRHRLARDKALDLPVALKIAREVASALHYAHEMGVIHRDIKPGNMLVSGDTVKLSDFGISKQLADTTSSDGTATGIVGTPWFLSREIIREALAGETSSLPAHFTSGKVHINTLQPDRVANRHRRRFDIADPAFQASTTGEGGVIAASAQWMDTVRAVYRGTGRDAMFEPDRMAAVIDLAKEHDAILFGPFPRFVAVPDRIAAPDLAAGYELRVDDPSFISQVEIENWPHTFRRRRSQIRPLKGIAVIIKNSAHVGAASLTADADQLWQIGVDVLEEHRGQGLAAAMTAALALEALANNAVPYYGTTASNIPSMRAALSAGFRPGWVDAFTLRRSLVAPGVMSAWLSPRR
ncbi:MAG: serine/threonine protein kinase [Gemmatimonadetes bacterium]|nr:serine/threonine protein kinase [Gemmatimonadota bacterium]